MELTKKQESAVSLMFDDISDTQLKEDIQTIESLLLKQKFSDQLLFINELLIHEAHRRGWIL